MRRARSLKGLIVGPGAVAVLVATALFPATSSAAPGSSTSGAGAGSSTSSAVSAPGPLALPLGSVGPLATSVVRIDTTCCGGAPAQTRLVGPGYDQTLTYTTGGTETFPAAPSGSGYSLQELPTPLPFAFDGFNCPFDTANFTLAANTQYTCTAHFHVLTGQLRIVKQTHPAGISGPFTIQIPAAGLIVVFATDGLSHTMTVPAMAGYTLNELPNGGPSTFDRTDCGPGVDPSNIFVPPGGLTTCTVVNSVPAWIDVGVTTQPAGATGFGFSVDGGSPVGAGDGLHAVFAELGPGTHHVRMVSAPPGWLLTQVHCDGGTTTPAAGGFDITVTATDGIHCSVQVTQASLQVQVIPSPGAAAPGSTIHYTFVVTNPGTLPVSGITLADDLLGPIALGSSTLAPGASVTGNSTLQTSSGEGGTLVDTATATGAASAEVTVAQGPTTTVPVTASGTGEVSILTARFTG